MKDQYFGDVNDFRKYGLLRRLIGPDRLKLGVCWMLTAPDGRTDGRRLAYLCQPGAYRHRDPELYDWLTRVVTADQTRATRLIEAADLLGAARFHSELLADASAARDAYFQAGAARLIGCDLVFLDPDNGLEVRSVARGRKDSCKYVYWSEVSAIFAAGASVLIYQHFPRAQRGAYTARLAGELQQRTRAAGIFSFRTAHVLFLLAAQRQHALPFRRQLAGIESAWGPDQIAAQEHAADGSVIRG